MSLTTRDEKSFLRKDPGDTREKLEDLRSRIQNNSEKMLNCPLDDWYLLRSLRCTQFEVNDAYEQLKCFWNVRETSSEFFKELADPEFLDWVKESRMTTILDEKAGDGSSVIVVKFCKWDSSKIPILFLTKLVVLVILSASMDSDCQENGVQCIVDVEGATWKQFRAIGINGFRFFTNFAEDCAPCFFKNLVVLNGNFVSVVGLRILASLSASGFAKNLKHFGRNFEKLYKLVPRHVLPDEFGGTAGPMDAEILTTSVHDLVI